ncbi:YmfQ family protein [Paenibacillus sp. N1-5-1-14]|uniref:YmfQ family protein n=1 Tax=Paenibacillus radicibacter TaxID=2972488 RepID=UPI0021595EEF|nr:YmfQ family protein [Paenibacillus radicibacter]MCR8645573.1 YmfQ family protein [Paenibacillus radicibacter]
MRENVLTSPKGKELFEYLPAFYEPIYEIRTLVQTEGLELDTISNQIESILDQTTVGTATWSLERWEKEFGVRTEAGKPVDQRRSVVISKIRGTGTITSNLIKAVAESYANGEVAVTVDYPTYTVQVEFIGKYGIPPNIEDLKSVLRGIVPAHLEIEYKFKFVTFGQLEFVGKTFGEIESSGLTMGQLETNLP